MRTEASSGEVSFQAFLQTWLPLLQSILDRLVEVPREAVVHKPEHRALVAAAIDHFASYFSARSRQLTRRDPTMALCPPWVSLATRALLWMGGWRPTAALLLVPAQVLSAEQVAAVEAIRVVMRAEVAAVEEEMRRVQNEGVVGLLKLGWGAAAETAAVGRVVAGQRRVVVAADCLRMEVMRRVVEVLAPLQAVDFLVAVVRMEISMQEI